MAPHGLEWLPNYWENQAQNRGSGPEVSELNAPGTRCRTAVHAARYLDGSRATKRIAKTAGNPAAAGCVSPMHRAGWTRRRIGSSQISSA